jgi:hypothetical protein
MPPEAAEGSADDALRVAQPTDQSGAGNNASASQDEDLSTEAWDRAEAPSDDAERNEPGGGGEDTETAAEGSDRIRRDQGEDGLVEIEHEGVKVRVPPAMKDAFMRYGDYNAGKAEINKARDELATLRTQIEESRAALPEEHRKVAFLERDVAQANAALDQPLDNRGMTLRSIDWAAWRNNIASLPDDAPEVVTFKQYRRAYDDALQSAQDGQRALDAAKSDLTAKEEARLAEQRTKADEALAAARQETGAFLKAQGWDEQRFADTASWAVQEYGLGPDELSQVTDPRTWMMADRLRLADLEVAKLRKALGQKETADANLKAQQSRPAETPKGNAQPARVRDDLGTKEWMRRRNAQVAKRA